MVLNASDILDKVQIEQKVIQAGGRVVQSPPSEFSKSFLVICGKDCGIRVKNFKSLGKFDIINYTWLIECEKQGRLLPLKPQYHNSVLNVCSLFTFNLCPLSFFF